MILVLVRHGEVDYTISENPDITQKGISQAHHTAEKLSDSTFTQFFVSPLPRALQTAKIIGHRIQKEPTIIESLREIKRTENKENKKINEFFESLCYKENQKILFVIHENVILYILSLYLDITFEQAQKMEIHPCAITIINTNKPKIICVNSYHHIPKDLFTRNTYRL